MALSNLAGLYGILQGIGAGTDIQQQQQELRQREQLFNQQQAAARLQGLALQGLMQQGGTQGTGGIGGGMPFGGQQMIPPMPLPQTLPSPTEQGGQLAPDVQRGPSGQLTMGGRPPTGMLPGGIPTWDQSRDVRGSWFGNAPGWRDPSDSGLQAGGQPVSAGPGIALPADLPGGRSSTLGQRFDVTAPSGQTLTLPQTDIGPSQDPSKTGGVRRGIDVNALGAQAFGYTPQNFPTNQMFKVALHRDTTQAGMAALQAGVPQPAARDVVQAGQAAINELDPTSFGRNTLREVAQAVDKAQPDADPVIKSMAIGGLMKLLQPADQQYYRLLMQQNRDEINVWKTLVTQSQINARAQEGGFIPYQPPGGGPPVAFSTKTGQATGPIEGLAAGSTRVGQADPEEKIPPQTQVFNAFMKAHPNATAEQQQQFLLSGKQPRSAQGMALRTFIDEFTAEQGHAPSSQDIINFQAGAREQLTEAAGVGQRAGALETAAQTLDSMAPLLEAASNKISRTDYPTINKLILAYQEGTGSQEVAQYGEMLNEIRYLYGRALGGGPGGQARVADINHFDEVMNRAWSQGVVKAGLDQIRKSIQVERDVLQRRRQEVRGGGTAPAEKPQGQQIGGDSLPVPDSMKNEDDGSTILNKRDGSLWIKKGNQLIRAPAGAEPTPPASAGAGSGQP